MEHIYPMCGMFYLPSIDNGNVSPIWDFVDEGAQRLKTSPAKQASILTTRPLSGSSPRFRLHIIDFL